MHIWRHGQVVRQRSATPLSPVQIWLAPELKSSENLEKSRLSGFFLFKNNVCKCMHTFSLRMFLKYIKVVAGAQKK